MRISLGCDHRGRKAIDELIPYLRGTGHEVVELGFDNRGDRSCDYPDRAWLVANAVSQHESDRGILVCGTGIGVCISANKVPGIRAALTHVTYSAERAALSNNAQIITMGARVIGPELAKAIADAWLAETMNFDAEGRSAGNVNAIDAVDAKYNKG